MSQASFCGESSGTFKKLLKRKRQSSNEDEDLENMPPTKQMASCSDHSPEVEITLESSSPLQTTSEEEVGYFTSMENQDFHEVTKSISNDGTYSENSLSSFSLNEAQISVLSPLENINIPRGDSTPHSSRRSGMSRTNYRESRKKCPLPSLSWANSNDVWERMCVSDIDSAARRTPRLIERHTGLQIRMRAILIDWLNEVSEVFKLQRETFHLSIDYIDRYLSNTEDIPKARLQLIGITCLFIASKVEEVYPPKLADFAYVTDSACTGEEILKEEIVILQATGWSSPTITMNAWLKIYMQLCSEHENARKKMSIDTDESRQFSSLRPYTFVFPQYSSMEFLMIGQLIDFVALHVGINSYPYSMVAASAVSHVLGIEIAVRVSGYTWEEMEPCHVWMTQFLMVLEEEGLIGLNRPIRSYDSNGEFMSGSSGLYIICPNINLDENHRIQVHNVSLEMFDKVELRINESKLYSEKTVLVEESPASGVLGKENLVTPPQTKHKGSAKESTIIPNLSELSDDAKAI